MEWKTHKIHSDVSAKVASCQTAPILSCNVPDNLGLRSNLIVSVTAYADISWGINKQNTKEYIQFF